MKALFDFLPIILFFVAFKVWDIYVATGVAMAVSIIAILYMFVRSMPVSRMQWLSLVIIVVFGGATLLTHNETFIKWKPTVLYWLMGGALLVGMLFKKNFVKSLISSEITLPDNAWHTVSWAWIGYFAFMGALNLWVALTFSTDTWANFKLYSIGLTVIFGIGLAVYMSRFMKDDEEAEKLAAAAKDSK